MRPLGIENETKNSNQMCQIWEQHQQWRLSERLGWGFGLEILQKIFNDRTNRENVEEKNNPSF